MALFLKKAVEVENSFFGTGVFATILTAGVAKRVFFVKFSKKQGLQGQNSKQSAWLMVRKLISLGL